VLTSPSSSSSTVQLTSSLLVRAVSNHGLDRVWRTWLTAAVFLLASECSIFKNFFARDWPLLSPSHGFNFLGFCMIVIGNNILGNLNKQATSQESLGLPFWRLVIGAGIVIFILGWTNIIAASFNIRCTLGSLANLAPDIRLPRLFDRRHSPSSSSERCSGHFRSRGCHRSR
jgi:hypothetical protein